MTRAERDTEYGSWLNTGLDGQPLGYHADLCGFSKPAWWSAEVPLYRFQLDTVHPLTWILGKQPADLLGVEIGSQIQPCKVMIFDWASIPSFLQWAWSPERFFAAIIHDDAYKRHKLWLRRADSGLWLPHDVTRWQADKLLEHGIGAQDGTALARGAWFQAVRIGGSKPWNRITA